MTEVLCTDKTDQIVYRLHGIPFVPHYVKRGVFVAPTGIERSENVLLRRGAKAGKEWLWIRGEVK